MSEHKDIQHVFEGKMHWFGVNRDVEIHYHTGLEFHAVYRVYPLNTMSLSFILRKQNEVWEYRLSEDPGRALMPERWRRDYQELSPVATAIQIIEEQEDEETEPFLEEVDQEDQEFLREEQEGNRH